MQSIHLIYSEDHDSAIVMWDAHPADMPLDAVNMALWRLGDEGHRPYIYEAYDGNRALGLIICANTNWDADAPVISGDESRCAAFNRIFDAHRTNPQNGDWAPQEFAL